LEEKELSTDTLFIRHKMSSTPQILENLWKADLIAVHYTNSDSTDPEHYRAEGETSAANALSRLHSCLKTGAIVAASYRQIKPAMLKVGRIDQARSKIAPRRFTDPHLGDFTYKIVNLVDVQNIELRVYPILAAIQPRGGTLTGWPSAANILKAIIDKQPLSVSLESLHPSQLEVLCYEYLRNIDQLKYLLTPIGRNMYEIDICGIDSNGKMILAQVTHSNNKGTTEDKSKRLMAFEKQDCRLIYFGPLDAKLTEPKVVFVPIERVFEHMLERNKVLVEKMINPV
jgi:hypothetical protein